MHWILHRFMKYRFVRHRLGKYWFRFVSRPWLDADIPSKYFFLSPRRLQDMSARSIFKTFLKTKNCYAEEVLKTSSRHVLNTFSRRLEDRQMFAGLLHFHLKILFILRRTVRIALLALSHSSLFLNLNCLLLEIKDPT